MNYSPETCTVPNDPSSDWWKHHLTMANLLRWFHSHSISGPGRSNAHALELALIGGTWMLPPENSTAGALPVAAESPASSDAA